MQDLNQITLWQNDASSPIHCTLSELESLLNFHYLPHLKVNPEEKILEKGIEKWEKGAVLPEHILNGILCKDEILSAFLPQASVRWCNDQIGWGLFAEEDLDEGVFAGEYTGYVRKNDEHHCLNNYLYRYPVPDSIGRDYVIDATTGNLMRFVNHSSKPNLKTQYAFLDGFYHLIFLTLRPIKQGEQFAFDYGQNYWYVRSTPKEL